VCSLVDLLTMCVTLTWGNCAGTDYVCFWSCFFLLYCEDYACLVWSVLSMVYDYLLYVVMWLLCIYSQFPVVVVDVIVCGGQIVKESNSVH
jgi:hypothetical protein